jgi:hypothetical protein
MIACDTWKESSGQGEQPDPAQSTSLSTIAAAR